MALNSILLAGSCVGPEVLFSLLLGYLDRLEQGLWNYTEVNINFEVVIIFSFIFESKKLDHATFS